MSASGGKTARVVVQIFLIVVCFSGVSGGVGGWRGCNNVNVDTFLILACVILACVIFFVVVSLGFRGGGDGGGVIMSMLTPS